MNAITHFASLSYIDSLLAVVGAGLISHLIFKRTETHEPVYIVLLLLGIPTLLIPLLAAHSSSIPVAVLTTLLTYWFTLSASILTYRVSPWHPLAKYPGPLICKITKFWFAYVALKGKQHIYYAELHEKYGNIVRVGPNELSIRDADAIDPLMGPTGLSKGPFWEGRVPEHQKIKAMISIRNKQEHHRRRKHWNHAFSTSALKGYEGIVTNRCTQFVETLEQKRGAVDLTQLISFFAYDLMVDMAFGGGSEMMRDGDVDGLWHLLEVGQKNAIFMSHVPWLGALLLRYSLSLANDLQAFRANALERTIKRKAKGSTTKDLFYYLMNEEGTAQQPLSVPEFISDGILAIIAGSDTTSSTLVNLFYFLLANPTTYKRLQAEIDDLGDRIMDYTQLARLPYLNAAINESLRLLPAILSGSQRATEKGSGGSAVGPYFVPEGTSAFIPFFSLHRDPRYFSPLPNSFIPERWLSPETQLDLEPGLFKDQKNIAHNTNAFIPFSFGPANCVGKNLALMEMRMLVCLTMSRFEVRFEEGYPVSRWEEDMLDYFIMVKGRLPVVLTPRKCI